jgi:hypothetical protein
VNKKENGPGTGGSYLYLNYNGDGKSIGKNLSMCLVIDFIKKEK